MKKNTINHSLCKALATKSIQWTAKYGSVIAAGFDVTTADMNFNEGSPTKKLKLTDGAIFAGNAAAQFQPAEPFKFLPAEKK